MKFAYVLPDPNSYPHWGEFEGDLDCIRVCGYDAVELQIADPEECDVSRLVSALQKARLPLCAVQTGATYATRGNCLCTPDEAVRQRTLALLLRFADFAEKFRSTIVFGSLQGRIKDEPDLAAGRERIVDAIQTVGRYAAQHGIVIAYEPVNHLEVAYHHTIAEVFALVEKIALPSVRMMIDSFHMNIEEHSLTEPIPKIASHLAHVHLSETNRDVLGRGHLDIAGLLQALRNVGYAGYVSVGVYNSRAPRREAIELSRQELLSARRV